MKIIDLLNKIANGDIPKNIKFNDYEYSYHDKEHGYCRYNYDNTYICIDTEYYLFDILNDEVEILEKKKIPENIEYVVTDENGEFSINGFTFDYEQKMQIIDTLNQVIDYLKSKGE